MAEKIPLPASDIDQEAEITGAKFLLEKRIRAVITNQWGTVNMVINIQGGRITSIRDSEESVWQAKRQKPTSSPV